VRLIDSRIVKVMAFVNRSTATSDLGYRMDARP
jgi:hypothetical protein